GPFARNQMVGSPNMPAALRPLPEVLDLLLDTFRRDGYDGASLSRLSEITGLGKSSLYHYFPRGKEEMLAKVLRHLEAKLERELFEPLRADGAPRKKLDAMLAVIDAFYEGGKRACLLERACASVDRSRFRKPLEHVFASWIGALEDLCVEAGVERGEAKARAEDAIARIEGALVLCAALNDTAPFRRALKQIRDSLLAV
ncbi:partial putative HTH-type transcriptional regulator YxaF, partial [Planctomycetaceae bacterium]